MLGYQRFKVDGHGLAVLRIIRVLIGDQSHFRQKSFQSFIAAQFGKTYGHLDFVPVLELGLLAEPQLPHRRKCISFQHDAPSFLLCQVFLFTNCQRHNEPNLQGLASVEKSYGENGLLSNSLYFLFKLDYIVVLCYYFLSQNFVYLVGIFG